LLHELQSASLPEDLITVTHTFQPWLLSSVPSFDTLGGFPPCSQVWQLFNISAPYAMVAFQALPTSLPKRLSFLGFLFNIVPNPIFPDEVSFALCHSSRRVILLLATTNFF
jgi:hypothetical protein